ncbi:hypothetical protein [Deinococcus maricopensis]|uniref:Uncharacterized protein n=1 Tax=Deinococcus maricopensis (strain DSM 21211 / LMG 22137 / NRRL B-23946 / LB-34) TaxID=709986 RepID=E8U3A6_DEIML|nr:hypothetical protein [Deinococcus maricopensis]ADV66051.1 hypothetical protein Deima_0391 [Deinococcus maricopensis DSM 21211]
MSGLSAGLRALRAQRGTEDAEQDAPEPTPATPAPRVTRPAEPAVPAARPEARETFSTKLKPSLRLGLKRHMLALEEDLGHRVRLEDVMEALIARYLSDDTFRATVDGDLPR